MGTKGNPYAGNIRVLLLTTGAFFLTFVVWFNMAPFNVVIKKAFDLTPAELGVLMSVNVALTIPARILIGQLVDTYGPRKVFSALLVIMGLPAIAFAMATEYWQLVLLRLALSCIGAGFVVGIRMVSEWFPPARVGTAEGIYAGWGNFGSAAAAFTLPLIALALPFADSWRWAIGLTGLICMVYGVIYYRSVTDTPPGVTYLRAKRSGMIEVTSKRDLWGLLGLLLPPYLVLGVLAWRVTKAGLIPVEAVYAIFAVLGLLYLNDARKAWKVNRPHLERGVPDSERYPFSQVIILCIAYAVTFGGELAVVSMLPQFFTEQYGLSLAAAGMVASVFAFTNLFARPGGGWMADHFGRKGILLLLLAGLSLAYSSLGLTTAMGSSSLILAVALVLATSLFVQASEGAVYAIVPLIRKPLTGRIAGMVGAYGNVGAVLWLSVLQSLGAAGFFLTLGACGLVTTLIGLLLREPGVKGVSAGQPVPAETAETADSQAGIH